MGRVIFGVQSLIADGKVGGDFCKREDYRIP